MFYSLVQTIVCVLLINGGLYALHLSGGSGGSSSGSTGGPNNNIKLDSIGSGLSNNHNSLAHNSMLSSLLTSAGQQHHQQQQQQHLSHMSHNSKQPLGTRLSEELADMAQLERERLMLLGLAKQTAAANAANTAHNGRPIITGRIQMTPAEELDSDYGAFLTPQSQRFMYGSVVKHPMQPEDYESSEAFDGGGGGAGAVASVAELAVPRRHPAKYEYGHVVQPIEHDYDPRQVDLDDFMELETPETDDDDVLPDLDGYQYLEEIIAEQNKEQARAHPFHSGNQGFQNPYHTLEELETNPAQLLQEYLEREQQDEAKQHELPVAEHNKAAMGIKHRNGYNNIRLQQKWQRKRAQQQQQQQQQQTPLQRNIFGLQRAQHQQQHQHYSPQQSKLSIAKSEATAGNKQQQQEHKTVAATAAAVMKSSSTTADAAAEAAVAQKAQQQSTQSATATGNAVGSSVTSSESVSTAKLSTQQQQQLKDQQQQQQHQLKEQQNEQTAQREQLLHPNRKRSSSGYPGGMQPPVSHSIASQLMLRTARGQRQYDVPQIECPTAMDGMERFACPTPDLQGRYRCIDDHVLCDGFIDCPEGEDEDRRSCMFYKTTKAHLDVLADALLRWARGR